MPSKSLNVNTLGVLSKLAATSASKNWIIFLTWSYETYLILEKSWMTNPLCSSY